MTKDEAATHGVLMAKYVRIHLALTREVAHYRSRDWKELTNNEKITKVSLEKVLKEVEDGDV